MDEDTMPVSPDSEVRAARSRRPKRNNPDRFRYTDDQRARARELYEQGKGSNEIMRLFGWTAPKMVQLSREEGFDFGGQARRAAEATKARGELAKAELKDDMLRVARRLVERLDRDTYTLVYGGPTKTRVDEVPHAPGFEARDIAVATRNLLACVKELEEFEREREQGASDVEAFLAGIAGLDDGEGDDDPGE